MTLTHTTPSSWFCDESELTAGDNAVGAERDGYAGAIEHYEHTVHDGCDARVNAYGAVARTPSVGAIAQFASNGRYEHTSRDCHAGIIWHYECTVCNGLSTRYGTAGVIKHIGMARVARLTDRGSHVGAVGLYECTVRDGLSTIMYSASLMDCQMT